MLDFLHSKNFFLVIYLFLLLVMIVCVCKNLTGKDPTGSRILSLIVKSRNSKPMAASEVFANLIFELIYNSKSVKNVQIDNW